MEARILEHEDLYYLDVKHPVTGCFYIEEYDLTLEEVNKIVAEEGYQLI